MMSESLRIPSPVKPFLNPTKSPFNSLQFLTLSHRFPDFSNRIASLRTSIGRVRALENLSDQVRDSDSMPISINLQPVPSETQFDRILAEAQQLGEPVVFLWMASWCRKCIYLKPKLEKLAAEYYPRVRFYCVDVNAVSHKLVLRAEVTKMPNIQLWKDGKKQAEVIGGHKAYLVVNEVRHMIENEPAI